MPRPANETDQNRQVADGLSRGRPGADGSVRVFRNNTGMGWQGRSARATRENLAELRAGLRPGDLVIRGPRPLHAGLERGGGDLIGWRSTLIQPAMVGEVVAVFASLEGKRHGEQLEPHQARWAEAVRAAGGLAGRFESLEEARAILRLPG
ncbi:MAG: hypothetical protein VKO39_03435 [Cyanobacteriota bacterium]|nr:hypothetical protein [Cyanobacteriota bacterium]